MWKWTGTLLLTFTFAASACLFCHLYLTNTVDAMVTVCLTLQKNPKSWNIFDNTGCVLSERAVNGPETSRPGVPGPQITKFWWEHCCILISRFLWMSFCKGYSSHFNTSPSQFSLFEFLYMISLASKSLIVLYALDDCQISNAVWQNYASIYCLLLKVFGSRQLLAKLPDFKISLLGKDLAPTSSAKDLGVVLDPQLTFDDHVLKTTTSSCMSSLAQISRVKHVLDRNQLVTVINALTW